MNHSLGSSFNVKALQKLRNISWIILFCSITIDISHIRAFPSYNFIVGLWACYCGHYQSSMLDNDGDNVKIKQNTRRKQKEHSRNGNNTHPYDDDNEDDSGKDLEYLQKLISSFSVVASLSVLFDIIFCSMWGNEIFNGDYRSLKFSLVIFIFNTCIKVTSIFFALQIVFDFEKEDIHERNYDFNEPDLEMDGHERTIPSRINFEMQHPTPLQSNLAINSPCGKNTAVLSSRHPYGHLELELEDVEFTDDDDDEDDEYDNTHNDYIEDELISPAKKQYNAESFSPGVSGLFSPGKVPHFAIPASPPPPPPLPPSPLPQRPRIGITAPRTN